MRAKTLKQKTVRIITSASFFTDWNNAPTMVFRPARHRVVEKDASNTCHDFYCPSGGLVGINNAENPFKTDILKARGWDGRVINTGC